jgi:hypothetical protein
MCTRELGPQAFTGLQLMRLDHRPAITPASPGKPDQRTFILGDDDFRTVSLCDDFARSQNEVSRAIVVNFRLLRLWRRLLDLTFHAHRQPSNFNDLFF